MTKDFYSDICLEGTIQKLPLTYFQLIQKVGSAGKYQQKVLFIFMFIMIASGSILGGTSYFFLHHQFECQIYPTFMTNCQQSSCQFNQKNKLESQQNQRQTQQSESSQFHSFLCQKQTKFSLINYSPYLGPFLGFFIFSYLSDNMGRRKVMIASLFVAIIGSSLLAFSFNNLMAFAGLILAGAGVNTASSIAFFYFSEILENVKRQKYSINALIFFTLGANLTIILHYFLQDWRYIILITHCIPSLLALIFCNAYVEQTPQFLLKNSLQKALQSLNRIGQINYNVDEILRLNDIESVFKNQTQVSKYNSVSVNIFDLFSFPQIKSTTILSCLLSFIVFILYYGSVLIIDKMGFSIQKSSLTLQAAQFISFMLVYCIIQKVSRRKSGFIAFFIILLSSIGLMLIQKPEICANCKHGYIQIMLILIFRLSISYQYAILLVYAIQLFPTRVSGLGFGITSAFGALAAITQPMLVKLFKANQLNILILFGLVSFLGILVSYFLEQTKGKPIKALICQIQRKQLSSKKIQYFQEIDSQSSSRGQEDNNFYPQQNKVGKY